MTRVSDNDHLAMHPGGVRQEVTHACPDCPSPLAGGVARMPDPLCRWCRGTGLVFTDELAAWQRAQGV